MACFSQDCRKFQAPPAHTAYEPIFSAVERHDDLYKTLNSWARRQQRLRFVIDARIISILARRGDITLGIRRCRRRAANAAHGRRRLIRRDALRYGHVHATYNKAL